MGEGSARFVCASHLFEDVGEQEILPRLIGLAGNGTALGFVSRLESILPHVHGRDEVERFGIVEIKPTGMSQSSLGLRCVP